MFDWLFEWIKVKLKREQYEGKGNLPLGITQLVVLLGIFIYCVVIQLTTERHHNQQPVMGMSVAQVAGRLKSGRVSFDPTEYTVNQHDPDTFFIAMNLRKTRQKKDCAQGNLQGWCPKEVGIGTQEFQLSGIRNLTVLIKNWVVFAGGYFSGPINWSNTDAYSNGTALKNGSCHHSKRDKLCPIFKIGTILDEAKQNESTMPKGGVIAIDIEWKCHSWSQYTVKRCTPKYKFSRVDNVKITSDIKGWKFRYANHFESGARELIKATGIRFIIRTVGYGYSFDLIKFVTQLGGFFGFMGAVTVVFTILLRAWNVLIDNNCIDSERADKCSNCCRKEQPKATPADVQNSIELMPKNDGQRSNENC